MNIQHTPTEVAESCERHTSARLQRCWFLVARGMWFALVILTLAIFFASLPVYLALLQTPCAGTACEWKLLTSGQVATLTEIGLSIGAYTAIIVALVLASVVVSLVVSTVIAWRRSNDRMALIVALMLVTFGPIMSTTAVMQSPSPLAGTEQMLDLSLYDLAHARLPPVSQRAVRASLGALDTGRISRSASPFHLLPSRASPPE